jgi:hypothetical protein
MMPARRSSLIDQSRVSCTYWERLLITANESTVSSDRTVPPRVENRRGKGVTSAMTGATGQQDRGKEKGFIFILFHACMYIEDMICRSFDTQHLKSLRLETSSIEKIDRRSKA